MGHGLVKGACVAAAVTAVAVGVAMSFAGRRGGTGEPPAAPAVPKKGGPVSAVVLTFPLQGPPRVARFNTPEAIAELEKCFPNYRARPESDIAGGWTCGAEVYFNFPHGNTVRLVVSHATGGRVLWSAGRGDFAVKGDFYRLVAAARAGGRPEAVGGWSKPVKGLRARLVLVRDRVSNGTPIIEAYVDLHNVSNRAEPAALRWAEVTLRWSVTDEAGKAVDPKGLPGNELVGPPPHLVLPNDSTLRMRVSHRFAGIGRDQGGHLDLGAMRTWVFDLGDRTAYFLGGSITVPPGAKGDWAGALELPKVKIPLAGE